VATVWAAEGGAFAAAARSRGATTGVPWLLADVSWQMALGMGSGAGTGIKTTTGVMEFSLARPAPTGAASATSDDGADATTASFRVEFTRDSLLALLEKLDTMAQQVDALSS